MTWEDSDWAYPSGSELGTICGEDKDRQLVPVPGPILGSSLTDAGGTYVDPVRVLLWTLMAMLSVCVCVLSLASWQKAAAENRITAVPQNTYPMQIVFGDRGTDISSPYGPNGTESACTDKTWNAQSGMWSCAGWAVDQSGLPIAAAEPTDGTPCSEQRVDQTSGHWVCVSSS